MLSILIDKSLTNDICFIGTFVGRRPFMLLPAHRAKDLQRPTPSHGMVQAFLRLTKETLARSYRSMRDRVSLHHRDARCCTPGSVQ
jgi:hypothetical protein